MERQMQDVINQYAIYTRDPKFAEVLQWVRKNELKCEPHLNRTRFWVPEGVMMTEFLLRYMDACPRVNETEEHI